MFICYDAGKNLSMSENEILRMKNINIKDCVISELVDITGIEIKEGKTKTEKIIDYINMVKNPYAFRVGDVAVKIIFNEEDDTIEDKMQNVIDNFIEKEVC